MIAKRFVVVDNQARVQAAQGHGVSCHETAINLVPSHRDVVRAAFDSRVGKDGGRRLAHGSKIHT